MNSVPTHRPLSLSENTLATPSNSDANSLTLTGNTSFNFLSSPLSNFVLYNENIPPEKGDASNGTREVFCIRCTTYVKHRRERYSKSAACVRIQNQPGLQNFEAKACTNVPIVCKFCLEVHWKYNMHQHLLAQHPGWEASTVQGRELQDFRVKIAITDEEESKLGIPEPKQGLYCLDIPAMRHSNPMLLPSIRDRRSESRCADFTYPATSTFKFTPPFAFLNR